MARILIVDDEAPIRDVLGTFLAELGYEPVPVSNGESALETMRERKPDLVLLDVRMPGLSGLEVLRMGRKLYPDLAVIMISGYADEALARDALKEGAYDFFLKPFDLALIETRLFTKLGLDESHEAAR